MNQVAQSLKELSIRCILLALTRSTLVLFFKRPASAVQSAKSSGVYCKAGRICQDCPIFQSIMSTVSLRLVFPVFNFGVIISILSLKLFIEFLNSMFSKFNFYVQYNQTRDTEKRIIIERKLKSIVESNSIWESNNDDSNFLTNYVLFERYN